MATDDKNNDPEQDDFFGDDDDDFGLPELEYEALDDDSDSSSDDEMSAEEEVEEFIGAESNEEESLEDLDLPDSESIDDFSDDEEIPDQISDEELEAAMDEEISDEELNEFYEEESFEDFESDDSGDLGEETDSIFDSDGIDSDEFKDFEQGLASETPSENKYVDTSSYSSADKQEAKGKFTRVVIIGIVVFVTVGLAFLFAYNNFSSSDEKPVAEKVVKKKPVTKKPEPKPVVKETPKEEISKPVKAAPETAKSVTSTPGTINSLTERTGNTHMIIASFLDEDMATDYANELAAEGKSPSLILPFGKAKTTRVAIRSYPSLADAQLDLETYKAEYGSKVWIMKY